MGRHRHVPPDCLHGCRTWEFLRQLPPFPCGKIYTIVSYYCQAMGYCFPMEHVHGLKWAIAKVIKDIRLSKGWTQEQLAGFSGLSTVYIAKMERGVCGDSINALVLLATATGMKPSAMMQAIENALAAGPQKPVGVPGRPAKTP